MIEVALLAIGLVLIVEGLVYALAPSLIEDLLDRLRTHKLTCLSLTFFRKFLSALLKAS